MCKVNYVEITIAYLELDSILKIFIIPMLVIQNHEYCNDFCFYILQQ